jgi:thioredoxin 2
MKKGGNPYLVLCASCHTKNRIPAEKINADPVCGKCHTPLNLTGIFDGKPVIVSDATFEKEVLGSTIPVVLLFWATWCSACQAVIPTLERIADKLRGRIKIAKVNMEQNRALASRFHVLSVPLMLVFDNGKVKETMLGALSELDILQKLARYF